MINEHFGTLQSCIDPEQRINIKLAHNGDVYCYFKDWTVIGLVANHALMQARDVWGNFHYFDIADVISVYVDIPKQPEKKG